MPPTILGSTAFSLAFEIEGGDRISVGLSRFADRLKDLRPFWREYVAPKFFDTIQRNFQLQGGMSESAGGWAALSPKYAAWKSRKYPGMKILQRMTRLMRSLAWEGERVGPEGVFQAERTWAILGTGVPYARYHQRGSARLPRRRILFFPLGASESYGRLLHTFAVEQGVLSGLPFESLAAHGARYL